MTQVECFKALVERLESKNMLPAHERVTESETKYQLDYESDGFLDYGLCSPLDYELVDFKPDHSWIEANLNYGGSEGIYLDLTIVEDIYDEIQLRETRKIDLGTFKTLKDDRLAMHTMADILADILVESSDLLWEAYKKENNDKS